MNSMKAHEPTVSAHQRHIDQWRPKYMMNAHPVVHSPITIANGISATNPRILIHHSIAPQNAKPNPKPSHPASRAVVTRRIAHSSGAGATKIRIPQSTGGKASHMRKAEESTAKTCMKPRW
jgi:hypothetical protein